MQNLLMPENVSHFLKESGNHQLKIKKRAYPLLNEGHKEAQQEESANGGNNSVDEYHWNYSNVGNIFCDKHDCHRNEAKDKRYDIQLLHSIKIYYYLIEF